MFALCNRQHTVPFMPDYSYRALPTSSSSSSSATILSQTTLNILQCNFSAEPLLILFLVRETGTSTGCFCSISNKLRFILVFSFITNAKMQNGKPAIISETQDGMVWYGMSWNGMAWDVCLSVDRWSLWPPMIKFCVSFEAYMRKCLWSPHLTPRPPWVRTSSCSSCIHRSGPMHLNLSGRQPNRSTTNQPQSSSVSHHASLRSLPMCTQKNYALINHLH